MQKIVGFKKSLVFLVVFSVLSACGPTVFMFAGQTYQTAAEGLSAQRNYIDATISKIEPVPTPYAGRATIFVPTELDIRTRALVNPENHAPDAVNYVVTTTHRALSAFHELVTRRNLFESAELRDVVGSIRPEIRPGEHAIWVQLLSPNHHGWKYFTADMPEPATILIDNSLPEGGPRFLDWLDRLAREVERNGGQLASGAVSGGQAVSGGASTPLPASSTGAPGTFKRTLN